MDPCKNTEFACNIKDCRTDGWTRVSVLDISYVCSNLYSLVLLHGLFIPGRGSQHIQVPGHRTAKADKDTHKHTHINARLSAITLHHSTADDSVEKYPWGVLLSATLLCPAKNPKQSQSSESIEPSFGCLLYPHLTETFSSLRMQFNPHPNPKLI